MNVINSIQTILDAAREELLDLSLRNPLISYRLLKTRGVEVIDESSPDVYRILVQEGKAISFLPKPEPEENDSLLFEDNGMVNNLAQYTGNKLQTNHSSTELQSRLSTTKNTAQTALQEQGVTTLYLALGMLRWYESESSDILRRAPLILIPVEIDRASVRARFYIRYTGEEIGTNLSLQEKLKLEFGIQLPLIAESDDPEQLNIRNYYQEVDSGICHIPRWSIDECAIALGFFSFTKFLMYHDLDATNWFGDSLSEHSVLRALLTSGFQEPKSSINPSTPNIDKYLSPVETHHVVDADSSQALAIHDVSQGRNLAIQGPPGTGKSQTITNLIAEAIAKGKRVLFVAEKMAALDVVKRNLDEVGLGDACLELHSHKMNKKAVIDELKQTFNLGQQQRTLLEREVELLINDRDRLNNYCQAVNMPIGENGITPFQAYGELLAVDRHLSGIQLPTLDLRQFQHSLLQFRKGLAITEELQTLLKSMGIPTNHPFWGSLSKLFLPADRQPLVRAAAEAKAEIIALKDSSNRLAQHLKFPIPDTYEAVENLVRVARRALDAPNLTNINIQSTEWRTHRSALRIGLSAGERLNELHSEHDSILIREAWEQNVLEIRQVLAAYGGKWWRFLSGKYWRACNELTGLCTQPLPKTQETRLRIVDAILEAQHELSHLEKIQECAQRLFGTHWQGEFSNWFQLQEIVGYLSALHESVANGELPEALVTYLAANPGLEILQTLVSTVEEHQTNHSHFLQTVTEKIQLDETGRDRLKACSLTQQIHILECWEREAEKLQDMVTYNHLAEELRKSDFAEIVKIANVWSEANQFLSDVIKQAWYGAQVETAMRERPILARFNSDLHRPIVERFKELDRLSLEYNKTKVAYEHWKHLPKDGPAVGQLGVLKKEFAKKNKHLPIRKLMEEAGNVIQTIKPIFMMSPLSVAKFLPPESVHFDWVVFDEASQVKPVDAFGAIIRGKQTVIVGDDRQLPPTDFFDKQIGTDDENEEENLVNNIDSILDLFYAKSAPQRMLRWHYRSRHESLIAVSNDQFYKKELELFPSPDALKEEVGLIYHHHPDTVFDRGGSRKNREEARIVAERVMEHARSQPHLTLGVATFSASQMTAIQDQLETLRRGNPSCETFFNAHPQEPFFVKNLENVQGDERDVILISVGYGRDVHGRLTMNFGPLNQNGGERRLNVLITRARWRCEVFSNLASDDIDLSRTKGSDGKPPRGVEVLKRYLKYAETGELDSQESIGREADSPFEEEVANALRKLGYQIEHQVGSAGYFIDLGVKDPERPGRYLLGIECDGATYHSAQSARDRDRLRQQVLEGLGWRIHRIWSTDWFKRQNHEIKKAAEAIEAAKVHVPPSPEFPSENDLPDSNEDDRVSENGTDVPDPSHERPQYKLAEPSISTNGLDLHAVSPFVMASWIRDIVEIESPVHLNEVARRIATAVGVSKIGPRIQDTFETAVRQATCSGRVRIKEQFLYWSKQEEVTVRDRSELPNTSRKLELIAPEEIEVAIKQVVSAAFGIEREELVREVPKLFGIKRATANIQQGVDIVVERLIKDGKLIWQGDSLVIP